ncbi:MAG TPA: STAS domain-containing protein [Actinoplanes sp.]|nr:STAS domain-containing protein [Actinoplanes sp.]
MTPETLTVDSRDFADHGRLVTAVGEIDHDTAGRLRAVIDEALADGRVHVVLDVAGVTFCDSGGLNLFVDAHRRTAARNGWFRLAAVSGSVRAVVDATNLDRYLAIYSDVETALDGD